MLRGRPVHLRGVNPRLQANLEMLSVDSLFTFEPALGPAEAALQAAALRASQVPAISERSA